MKVYIASSWKNEHAVVMLTKLLRECKIEVLSFVENRTSKESVFDDFDEWIESEDGKNKFIYDVKAAMTSNVIVYISPSGPDAWAEVGAAYASNKIVVGLRAKGETIGLMRRMVAWYESVDELLERVIEYKRSKNL